MISTVLAAFAGAFLYRVRGGFLPTGHTQLARAIWCAPTALLVALLTGNWIAGLSAFFMAWAGVLLPNEPWQRMETGEHWRNAAGVGFLRVLLLLAPVAWATHAPEALYWAAIGILNAPLYWLGWKLPARALGKFIDWNTAWGEAFFGALCWAAIIAAS